MPKWERTKEKSTRKVLTKKPFGRTVDKAFKDISTHILKEI